MICKICTKCNILKSIDEFHWAGKYKNGARKKNPRCKICMNEYDRIRNKNPKCRQRIKEYNKKRWQNISPENREKKNQKSCEWFKNLSPQKRMQRNQQTLRWLKNRPPEYKEQRRLRDRKRYKELSPEKKEKLLKNRAEYFKGLLPEKKKKAYKRTAIWARNHPEKVNERVRQYKNRHKTDINYILRERIRGRISDAVKRLNNSESTAKRIGCTLEFLKNYFQSKFQPGMNWENYGFYGWHIDHIKPLSSFDLSDPQQQKEAFHYTNLQPLWAKDNFSKGAKLETSKRERS